MSPAWTCLQSTEASTRDEPTSYYHRKGPLGDIMALLADRRAEGAAVIGLGAGTVACYGSGGAPWTFYEINPAVIAIANSEFRFLRESAGKIEVVEGDGRKVTSTPGHARGAA